MAQQFKCPNCNRMIRDRKALDACECPNCRQRWNGPTTVKLNPAPNPKPAQKVA